MSDTEKQSRRDALVTKVEDVILARLADKKSSEKVSTKDLIYFYKTLTARRGNTIQEQEEPVRSTSRSHPETPEV